MLLICFNQENSIDAAIDGALAQDYPNLEIVISDDASADNTYLRICDRVKDYEGPHTIKVLRNPKNMGIGGNLDQAVRQSHGALIFIAAGDDVSLPHRISTVVTHWLENDCKPNLIAAYLNDIDASDQFHGVIRISDLSIYESLEDWSRRGPPHVIGAAQAWTRRLFDEFGGIPNGVVGEDMVMAFRAIASGSAVTLPIPLVNYRRGGITSQRKSLSAADVIKGLRRKLGSSQTELRCLLKEAHEAGASQYTLSFIAHKLDKEVFIERIFRARNTSAKLRVCYLHSQQAVDFRIRIFVYAAAPWLLAPFFCIKRMRYRKL
ncbi:glycosyltransferase [Rhodoferax sp.]|uniref:glycosyltransferase n=1 Tax=Rhodoferax sp. TaxID=50421 RepID=UPI002ACD6F35|nr:glycosyltransferase [Rhodoferax sp.]MDZ7921047.1 glycosyltransferase [Rhodoferax sp.]